MKTDEADEGGKKEGYEGAEIYWPAKAEEQQEILTAVKKYGLELGLLCRSDDVNPAKHLAEFKKILEVPLSNKVQKPLYINCHTGRDFFSLAPNRLPKLVAGRNCVWDHFPLPVSATC